MAEHEGIEIILGRRVFHAAKGWYRWDVTTRCGAPSAGGWSTAGEAVRSGLRPCARCFPDDPVETWKVKSA